jgi:hypothetical protein
MGRQLLAVLAILTCPAVVAAQEFGTEWIDRVTHERMQERGPIQPKAVVFTGVAGVEAYNDNNVFLDPTTTNHRTSNVVVPFAGVRMDYAESQFEAEVDALGDWKWYSGYPHLSDFEEFLFGHARYVGSKVTLSFDELLRHTSDAVDAQFFQKARVLVSDSIGGGTVDIAKYFSVEAHIDYQVVRFDESPLSFQNDNENFRADATAVYRALNGMDWFLRIGYLDIYYDHLQQNGAPPDTKGYYTHVGFRGEPIQRLHLEAYAGWVGARSERFINTQTRSELTTFEGGAQLKYEATDKLTFYVDLNRYLTWAGSSDPFEVVNRAVGIAEYELIERLKLRARLQYDHVGLPISGTRNYKYAGISAAYEFTEHLGMDVGATYRTGDQEASTGSNRYKDSIVHAGLVITF